MTKRTLNIAEIIIYIITLVLLWIDGSYKMIGKSVYGSYKGVSICSFVDCAIDSTTIDSPIFPIGWIFIAFIVFYLVILFIEVLDIKKLDKKVTTSLSVALLALFLIISFYVDSKSGGTYEYNGDLRRSHLEMGTLFYVNVILLLISASFDVLKNYMNENKMLNTILNKFIVSKENTQDTTLAGTADELKKFKELLDSGVITQEEFDSKKKQLLDL